MKRLLILPASLALALAAPAEDKRPWLSPLPYPEGMRGYNPATLTQRIAVTNGRDTIEPVRIRDLPDTRWHQSGGMEGVKGWRSDKYYLFREEPRSFIGTIWVLNSFGHHQPNRGLRREYADGTRFDDVLSNERGVVFEHRSRTKDRGKWSSRVLYSDAKARPEGYTGLTRSCASCHDQAGEGSYNAGLVPGADGVLSDHLPWSLIGK